MRTLISEFYKMKRDIVRQHYVISGIFDKWLEKHKWISGFTLDILNMDKNIWVYIMQGMYLFSKIFLL